MFDWIKRHVGASIIVAAVVIYVVYEVSTYILVYTDDAYVATDVVFAAPEVPGILQALNVKRDQAVEEGEVLYLLDQEPFELALEHAEAEQTLAEAELKLAQDAVVAAQTRIESNQAILVDANKILKRLEELLSHDNAAQQQVDDATRDRNVAKANLADARDQLVGAKQSVVQRQAEVAVAKAAVAQATWALERTIVKASSKGRVGPVTARPGDYIAVGQAVLAVVTDDDWRIVANVRERFLQSLQPGQFVWYNLASEPWHWRRGKVRSLSAGVARVQGQESVLPWVDPATDWIRLPRRFPVEIDLLGLQDERRLFQGADASVLVVF
ncbi:MAG: biotin/lipoyl-binding protein [Kiloniellales bacterium]